MFDDLLAGLALGMLIYVFVPGWVWAYPRNKLRELTANKTQLNPVPPGYAVLHPLQLNGISEQLGLPVGELVRDGALLVFAEGFLLSEIGLAMIEAHHAKEEGRMQ